jgi:beta-glucosidase
VGIRNAVPATTPVTYAQGCDALCTTTTGFPAAVSAAKAAALTVVVLGEPASYSGEASSRSNIDLPGQQEALVEAIAATGKPYVVVLMNGRPLTIDWLANNAPGLIEAWQPGTEGGNAIADVLFGKVNPSGKLPVTFPRSVGQIPIYYNQLGTGRPYDPANKYTTGYLDLPNTPLYPFGYGLSYTSFAFSKVRLSATSVKAATGKLTVKADITNTGTTTGTDVVQLYIHNRNSGILQPVRQLEGFHRVGVSPGQTKTVTFTLTGKNLGYYDNNGKFVNNAGSFDVWVGDSSMATLHTKFSVKS